MHRGERFHHRLIYHAYQSKPVCVLKNCFWLETLLQRTPTAMLVIHITTLILSRSFVDLHKIMTNIQCSLVFTDFDIEMSFNIEIISTIHLFICKCLFINLSIYGVYQLLNQYRNLRKIA